MSALSFTPGQFSTAPFQLDPESIQTSSILVSFCKLLDPQLGHLFNLPRISSSLRVNHPSDPSFFINSTTLVNIFSLSIISAPQSLHLKNGSGIPQDLCLDIHQSGRSPTIAVIRFSPVPGIHLTFFISSKVCSLKSLLSTSINHCSVALKITGFLQRSQ